MDGLIARQSKRNGAVSFLFSISKKHSEIVSASIGPLPKLNRSMLGPRGCIDRERKRDSDLAVYRREHQPDLDALVISSARHASALPKHQTAPFSFGILHVPDTSLSLVLGHAFPRPAWHVPGTSFASTPGPE